MSRTKRLSLSVVGLAAGLGLAAGWSMMSLAAPPQVSAPDEPAAPTVLLLSSGQVIRGEILEADDGYLVKTPFGKPHYKRRDVVKTFASIRELYEYKRASTPGNDPDELMKLARWCLQQKLPEEALEQIEATLALSPGLREAESMKFQIAALREAQVVDPGVMRTSTGEVEPPASLSSRALQERREAAQRSPLPLGMPVIPGMPQPQAVRQYVQFKEFAHRALQQKCAQCHNEDSSSSFQLIRARVRRDLENEHLVRANFDAVLRLVNPQEPARSDLLIHSITPHPPDNRPVLMGPNDPTYRLLDYWVRGLECQTAQIPGRSEGASSASAHAAPPRTTGPVPAEAAPNGGFASDRAHPDADPGARTPTLTPIPTNLPPSDPGVRQTIQTPTTVGLPDGRTAVVQPAPSGQILPGSGPLAPAALPPPSQFPAPTLLGGPPPAPMVGPGARSQDPSPPKVPASPAAKETLLDDGVTRLVVHPDGTQVLRFSDGSEVPVADTRALPQGGAPGSEPSIDKDALRQFLSGPGSPQ